MFRRADEIEEVTSTIRITEERACLSDEIGDAITTDVTLYSKLGLSTSAWFCTTSAIASYSLSLPVNSVFQHEHREHHSVKLSDGVHDFILTFAPRNGIHITTDCSRTSSKASGNWSRFVLCHRQYHSNLRTFWNVSSGGLPQSIEGSGQVFGREALSTMEDLRVSCRRHRYATIARLRSV